MAASTKISNRLPKRIVCMTEETTETLYLLGAEDCIVGISGYTVRPARARHEKPKVSAFTSAKTDKILELQPDLVLGFSDMQAGIAAELIKRGVNVMVFNQRSVQEILNVVATLGALVGESGKASGLIHDFESHIEQVKEQARAFARRPRVYFEEWDEPMISGIRWVSEIVEIAGGQDCFPERAQGANAKDRIISDPAEVVRRNPDIILGSWCGKKFRADRVRNRPGWQEISAVRHNQLFEIKSSIILQPGPAALTDGLDAVHDVVRKWQELQP